jgi:hypothetical protein
MVIHSARYEVCSAKARNRAALEARHDQGARYECADYTDQDLEVTPNGVLHTHSLDMPNAGVKRRRSRPP